MKDKPYRAPVSPPALLWIITAILLLVAVYGFGFEAGTRAAAKRISRQLQHCVCSSIP